MKPIKFKSPFWIIFFALIHVLVFFAGTVCLDNSRQYDSIEKVLTVALSALTQPLFSQFFYEDFNGYVKLLTFVLNSFIWGAVIWWTIKLACQKNRILTRKSLLSLLLLFFTFSTIVLFRRTVPSSIQDSPKEEMALLNTLLEARFSEEVTSGTSLIIKDTLSLKQIVRSSDINDVKKDLIQNALKRRLKEAIRDLFRKNTTNCDFSVIGNPSFNHVLILKKIST